MPPVSNRIPKARYEVGGLGDFKGIIGDAEGGVVLMAAKRGIREWLRKV
jgi:hypothetical protein